MAIEGVNSENTLPAPPLPSREGLYFSRVASKLAPTAGKKAP